MDFLFKLFAFPAAVSVAGHIHEWKRNRSVVICSHCGKEQPIANRFCSACGSSSLISAKAFEELRLRYFRAHQDERGEKHLRSAAIKRLRTLSGAAACARCNLHFSPRVDFCTSCGANIVQSRLSDDAIYEMVHQEFPNLIPNLDDYTKLAHERPERGTLGKIILGIVVPPNARAVAEWVQKKRFYFCTDGKTVQGPVTFDELRSMQVAGTLNDNTQICEAGTTAWQKILPR